MPCPSYMHSIKTNKHIFKSFSLLGSHTILIFPYQTSQQYSDGNPPPNGGKMQIRAGDLPRCTLVDKLLHSECNNTSAQKGYLLPFKVYTMERIYENNL